MDDDKEAVFELLKRVQKKLRRQSDTPEYISAPPTDLRQCDWGQVVEEVQKTAQWWKTRQNKQGETRILIDKICRNSTALESWLKLLPGGDYASRSAILNAGLLSKFLTRENTKYLRSIHGGGNRTLNTTICFLGLLGLSSHIFNSEITGCQTIRQGQGRNLCRPGQTAENLG